MVGLGNELDSEAPRRFPTAAGMDELTRHYLITYFGARGLRGAASQNLPEGDVASFRRLLRVPDGQAVARHVPVVFAHVVPALLHPRVGQVAAGAEDRRVLE